MRIGVVILQREKMHLVQSEKNKSQVLLNIGSTFEIEIMLR